MSPQETLFDELKRYVRFSEDDAYWLGVLRPFVVPQLSRIAEVFYDRIREHEGANDVLSDEAQIERQKLALKDWVIRILSGPYDHGYFEQAARIGRTHVRVGLPQHYMFTSMTIIRLMVEQIAREQFTVDLDKVQNAISKVLDLELAIMLQTYRDDYVARIQMSDRLELDSVGKTLARTERRFVHAVELAKVLVVGLDSSGLVRFFNGEAERVTGFHRGEVLGQAFDEMLLADEVRTDHGRIFAESIVGKNAIDTLESAIKTRTGKVRDVKWQLAYDPSDLDEEVVLFAIGQDITAQKALAERVRQSEKLAAVGTLAAGLAHEIRNPLNGALLHLTFLERGMKKSKVDNPDAFDAVQIVRQEIQRLSALVNEFLDFARPRPLQLQYASVRKLCEQAIQMVQSNAIRNHVTVLTDLPVLDLSIDVDGGKIEQVLLNLLHNAIDAMGPSGGGKVILRVRKQPRFALIEVEDEGPGISNPKAPIFDPFFSTKPQGTGLGLSIAHRIITDHGGTIDFASRPGKTIFRITLPIKLEN